MNIYDEKLRLIEKAEERVRIAEEELAEAEKELDDVLDFVENELFSFDQVNKLNEIQLIDNGQYAIEVKEFKDEVKQNGTKTKLANNENNFTWSLIGGDGSVDNKDPISFANKKDAESWIKEKQLRSNYKEVRIVTSDEINK